jgi:hypothetical protein
VVPASATQTVSDQEVLNARQGAHETFAAAVAKKDVERRWQNSTPLTQFSNLLPRVRIAFGREAYAKRSKAL